MLFRTREKNKSEDLNRKVEKFRKWWQDETGDSSIERSGGSRENGAQRQPSDSSFVYYEEG
jgi:hypothetical protein